MSKARGRPLADHARVSGLQRRRGLTPPCHLPPFYDKIIPMSRNFANFNLIPQSPTQKMPKAFFVSGLGNRQQATGNRQQATGNRQQATGNRQQATGNRQLYTSLK